MFKYFILIIFISSCSLTLKNNQDIDQKRSFSGLQTADYIEHLESFSRVYLSQDDVKLIKLRSPHTMYLNEIARKILYSSQSFFTSKEKIKIYIVNDETPFHFSLPGMSIFLSSGLLKKYIKNENILYCVMAYELVRSEKKYYQKHIIFPTGHLETKRVLSLLRLGVEQKIKAHKWSMRLLEKIGISTSVYLSWLQIQNRNSVDFSSQLGDINSISREEALFKEFIIQKSRISSENQYQKSSRSFYQLVRYIRRF